MKKTASILLLLSLVYQCLGCLGVFAWYGVNKQRISNELCENRDMPYSQCNGQCVLMKKLKALEDNETERPENSHASAKVETLAFLLPESVIFLPLAVPRSVIPIPHEESYQYFYSNDNFRPPRLPSTLI